MNINNKCNVWLNNNATAGWRSTNIIVYSHIYTDCFSLTSAKAINLFNTNKCQILYVAYILISLNVSSRMSYLEKLFSIFAKFLFTSKLYTMFMYHIFYYGNKSSKKVPVTDKCVKYFYASIQAYIVSEHIHIKTKVRHIHVHVLYIHSC